MKLRLAPLLIVAASLFVGAEETAIAGLEATASMASASVGPAAGLKRTIRLPALDFEFDLLAFCPEEQRPLSVSASIADTRQSFEVRAVDGQHHASALVTVPAAQIAPVVTENFCMDGDPQSLQSLHLAGTLTAQISLRCGAEEAQSAYFLSVPLDVRLVCEDPTQVAPLTDK